MAEYVMKDLVKKADLEGQLQIASAATSREEIGNPVYPPARRKLAEHGISCDGHAARQLRSSDYEEYDLLIGMDMANLRNMYRACGGDPDGKIHLLMEYADRRKGPHGSPAERAAWGEEKQGSVRSFRHRRKRRKADFASTRWLIPGTPATSTLPGGMYWRGVRGCWTN